MKFKSSLKFLMLFGLFANASQSYVHSSESEYEAMSERKDIELGDTNAAVLRNLNNPSSLPALEERSRFFRFLRENTSDLLCYGLLPNVLKISSCGFFFLGTISINLARGNYFDTGTPLYVLGSGSMVLGAASAGSAFYLECRR